MAVFRFKCFVRKLFRIKGYCRKCGRASLFNCDNQLRMEVMGWIEDFWADGNYGMRKIEAGNKERADAAREKRIDKLAEEEKERKALAAYLWKMEFHPGKGHCSSCPGEYEDGYMGGGVIMDGWCCCLDNRMENK